MKFFFFFKPVFKTTELNNFSFFFYVTNFFTFFIANFNFVFMLGFFSRYYKFCFDFFNFTDNFAKNLFFGTFIFSFIVIVYSDLNYNITFRDNDRGGYYDFFFYLFFKVCLLQLVP